MICDNFADQEVCNLRGTSLLLSLRVTKPSGVPLIRNLAERPSVTSDIEGNADMMNDLEYYRTRAAESRKMAERVPDPQIAKVHRNFARHYEAAVERYRPGLLVVGGGGYNAS